MLPPWWPYLIDVYENFIGQQWEEKHVDAFFIVDSPAPDSFCLKAQAVSYNFKVQTCKLKQDSLFSHALIMLCSNKNPA